MTGAVAAVSAVAEDTGAVADALAAVVSTGSGATGSRPQATDTAAAKRKESPTTFNPPNTLFMEYPFQPIDFVLITYDCSTVATCAIRAVAGVSGPLALRGALATWQSRCLAYRHCTYLIEIATLRSQ